MNDWQIHVQGCDRCKLVDVSQPKTLQNCCFVGAKYLRDYLSEMQKPIVSSQMKKLKNQFTKSPDGKVYLTTRKKLKDAMRYK